MNKIKKILNLYDLHYWKYLSVGFIVLITNIGISFILFSQEFFLQSSLHKNLGNIISLEIALLISFPLHKFITWSEGLEKFFYKLVQFHIISFLGILIRIVIFSSLIYLNFNWFIATFVSITAIVILNFIGFESYVFKKEEIVNSNELSYSESGSGSETLEAIEGATKYNQWISSKIEDYLSLNNLELGAGQGTIAAFLSEKFNLELYDLSETNQKILTNRFKKNDNIKLIGSDILRLEKFGYYDCIYSSNVLEHIEDDLEIMNHSLKLLKKGGFFVAIVPAMSLLFSDFDKKIGHFRRYSFKDRDRIKQFFKDKFNIKIIEFSFFNPIGALGWFIKMKLFKQKRINVKDALLMDKILPFIAWLDILPLGFGQSILIVIKKI